MTVQNAIEILLRKRQLIDNAIAALQLVDGDDAASSIPPPSTKEKPAGEKRAGRQPLLDEAQLDNLWDLHLKDVKPKDMAEHFGVEIKTIYNALAKLKKTRSERVKKKS